MYKLRRYARDYIKKYDLQMVGLPNRVIVTRSGNPGASAKANAEYFWNTGLALSHVIIENDIVVQLVSPKYQTWQCNTEESRIVAGQKGFPVTLDAYYQGRRGRGDMQAYNIVVVETMIDGVPSFSEETLNSTVEYLANLIQGTLEYFDNITDINSIFGQSEFSPVVFKDSPDGIVTPDALRALVQNELTRQDNLADPSEHVMINGLAIVQLDNRIKAVENHLSAFANWSAYQESLIE